MTGQDVKAIRLALGLTQVQLADRLRVKWRSVLRWERGYSPVPGPVSVLLEVWMVWGMTTHQIGLDSIGPNQS